MSALTELSGQSITWQGRAFLKAAVPTGDNRGKTFTIAQPLAGRYRIVRFFASGGMGLLLEGELTFTIGGQTKTLRPGEMWRIPGGVVHGCVAGDQPAKALDVFQPVRDEYR